MHQHPGSSAGIRPLQTQQHPVRT